MGARNPKFAWRLTAAFLLLVAVAFSQSLPTVKDWAGMNSAERLAWTNFKVAWNADSTNPEVEQLAKAALTASAAGDHATAVKDLNHAFALLRGQQWTPLRAFSVAFTAEVDHAVVSPGDTVKVHLGQSFALDDKLKGAMKVVVSLQDPTPSGGHARDTELKTVDAADVDWAAAPLDIQAAIPNNPCVNCRIVVSVGDVPIRRTIPIRVQAGLADLDKRIAAANDRIAALEAKGKPEISAALPSIQYRLSLQEPGAFNEADSALGALESGANPWSGRHGDFRMAYRSTADKSLQPYRLFIPSTYDGSKLYPLILALHGAGRDENFYFDSVQDGQFKTLAEKRGYIIACPRGRDPLSLFAGDGEEDVLEVLATVKSFFKVDPARIYLAGHNTGGAAVWSIAMHQPDTFAAVGATAPMVFFLTVDDMAKLKTLPQIVIQGDQDNQVPVKQTRRFTQAARQAGARVKYQEVSGAGHADVLANSLPDFFDWFDGQRRAGL